MAFEGIALVGDVDFPGFDLREGVGILFADFTDGFSGSEESQFPLLGDELPAVAGDFEAVGAGGFAGGSYEVANSSAGKFNDGRDFIFGLDRMSLADKTD